MNVVYIKKFSHDRKLTIGNFYKVHSEDESGYLLCGDNGRLTFVLKNRGNFETELKYFRKLKLQKIHEKSIMCK